jgi:hypothetical protein
MFWYDTTDTSLYPKPQSNFFLKNYHSNLKLQDSQKQVHRKIIYQINQIFYSNEHPHLTFIFQFQRIIRIKRIFCSQGLFRYQFQSSTHIHSITSKSYRIKPFFYLNSFGNFILSRTKNINDTSESDRRWRDLPETFQKDTHKKSWEISDFWFFFVNCWHFLFLHFFYFTSGHDDCSFLLNLVLCFNKRA